MTFVQNRPPIIITGGAGYIGSHVCKAIAPHFLPVTIDNLSNGKKEFVKWGPFYKIDIREKEKLLPIFEKYSPLAAMHFAALSSVTDSLTHPEEYYENNLLGSLHLLQACRKFRVKFFLFSSSCAVFGRALQIPIQETEEKKPLSPYGKTKKAIEDMLYDFDHAYGIKSIILRYFNAAGADLEGEIGEWRKKETHLIPVAVRSLLQQKTLSIYGNDFATKDGSAIRDYIHVTDIANAHLIALQWLINNNTSEDFHLGSGRGHSVLEILQTLTKITKQEIPYTIKGRREGEPEKLIADIHKARTILGWEPLYSDLKTILQTAYNWQLQRLENAKK